MNKLTKIFQSNFPLTIISILGGFLVGAFFLLIVGISPAVAYGKLFSSIFSNPKSMSYCLVYAVPLILTGLAVAFSFRTGVFNIGAEGQFVVGSMAACVVGILVPAPPVVLPILCFLAAALAGAAWALLVGVLKTRWGINEVLSMIMFNWIAFYLSNYIAGLPAIENTGNAEATANVQPNAMILLPSSWIKTFKLSDSSNWGFLLAIAATVFVYIVIEKTTLGYRLKAVGTNPHAALYGGINVNRNILIALGISGALAGMAGASNLLGLGMRISVFTAQEGHGFAGIVTALIGASNPVGVFFAGIFYGAIRYAGGRLNLVGAPSEVINVITGTVVFFIAIANLFRMLFAKLDKKKKGGE